MEDELSLKEDESRYGPDRPFVFFTKRFPAHHQVGLHYHHTLEVNLIDGVTGKIRVEGRDIDLSSLSVLVLAPDTLHGYDIAGKGGSMGIFHLSIEALAAYIDIPALMGAEHPLARLPCSHPAYGELKALIPPMAEAGMKNRLEFLERLAGLLKILSRALESVGKGPGFPVVSGGGTELRRLVAFTESRLAGRIDLESAADELGFSKSYFCRYFRRATGLSYMEYVRLARIERAKRLLSTGLTVTAACFASGFEDLSYFIRSFREAEGMTPGSYVREKSSEPHPMVRPASGKETILEPEG
jgi:AraC-like DNA-binding protein